MEEQWKPVPEFEGVYEVSDLGRVKRVKAGVGAKVGRILKPFVLKNGLIKAMLCREGKVMSKRVHRLVAQAFIPNPFNLPEVNHLGPRSDCRPSMLEWRSIAGHNLYHMQHDGKGVVFRKNAGVWAARYNPKPGKMVWIGSFATKEEAVKAREAAVDALPYIL